MSVDGLAPADAAVAHRSLPRRFREALAGRDDEDGDDRSSDELAGRAGPDGLSVLDHIAATVGLLSVLERAVQQVLTTDEPILHPGVVDPSVREFGGGARSLTLEEALLDLDVTAGSFAERIDHATAADWQRRGRVAGRDQSVTALELVRQAVSESIDHLNAAQRTIASLRGGPV